MMTMSRIEQMFRDNNSAAVSGDTVTISRSDYDKLMQFSELADLMDAVNQNYYQEPDTDLMLEYAAKGLMAGLDDPYSFYYNEKEWEES